MKLDKIIAHTKQRRQNNQRQPRAKPVKEKRIEPTPEQQAKGSFTSAGMAYKRTPVIDELLGSGQIASKHHAALWYYRQQAHRAQDDAATHSPSSPERMMATGTGGAVTGTIPKGMLFTPAQNEVHRIERDLGALLEIARAVAVDDMTLTQWAIAESGGRERLQGRTVVIVPRRRNAVKIALLELQFAAGRISY